MLETKSLASSEVVSSKTHEECRYARVQSGMYRHIVRVTFKHVSLAVSRPPCACAFGTPFSSFASSISLGIPTDCLGNECVARRGNLCYLLLLPHTTPHFHAEVWLITIYPHVPTCTMALVPIAKACVRTTHMARNFPWQHFTCGWKKFKVGN